MLHVKRKLWTGLAGLLAGLGLCALPAAASAQLDVAHDATLVSEVGGNGDGSLDPGEGFSLYERLLSLELDPLTGVTGTLSTGSPGVTLGTATSPYPDMTFASTATNTTPFTGSLAATAECGAPLEFTLALSTDQGPSEVGFRVPVGHAGPYSAYDAGGGPVPITDFATATSSLSVGTSGRVKDVDVRVGRITHTAVGDLEVALVAPDGTVVTLMDRRGGSGDNVLEAVFDQDAERSVTTGSAPFTGRWRPEGDLGRLEGVPAAGTWRLRVRDELAGDQGTLDAWGLDLSQAQCPAPPGPRLPPGEGQRSDKAQGQWPAPPGFENANGRAHGDKPGK